MRALTLALFGALFAVATAIDTPAKCWSAKATAPSRAVQFQSQHGVIRFLALIPAES